MNELQYYDATRPRAVQGWTTIMCTHGGDHPYAEHWWPDAHVLGYEHGFVNQAYDILQVLGGHEPTVADPRLQRRLPDPARPRGRPHLGRRAPAGGARGGEVRCQLANAAESSQTLHLEGGPSNGDMRADPPLESRSRVFSEILLPAIVCGPDGPFPVDSPNLLTHELRRGPWQVRLGR